MAPALPGIGLADMAGDAVVATFASCLVLNWFGFGVGLWLETDEHFDVTGLSTAVLALGFLAYNAMSAGGGLCTRSMVATVLALIWAIRLGGFLYYRVMKLGRDSRFEGMRANPVSMLMAWTMQGIWIWLDLMPITLLLSDNPSCKAFGALDVLGCAMWAVGFIIETVADHQKTSFRLDPRNKGKFVTSGLWSVVRYPNYAGEIMLWSGMVILCASGMSSWSRLLSSCISPISTAGLTLCCSGVPIQEKQAQKRWGSNSEYQAYRARTPMLIPRLGQVPLKRD